MKYFTTPAPITAQLSMPCQTCGAAPQPNPKVLSFGEWLTALVEDPKLWKNPADTRLSLKLANLVDKGVLHEGFELCIEDTDYARMMAVYKDPSFTFHPRIAKASAVPGGFMDILENPRDKPLEEPAPE